MDHPQMGVQNGGLKTLQKGLEKGVRKGGFWSPFWAPPGAAPGARAREIRGGPGPDFPGSWEPPDLADFVENSSF